MIDKIKGLFDNEQFFEFLIKILFPALVGLTIKIGVTMYKEKMTICRVILSIITGVLFVYLLLNPIQNNIGTDYQPLAYAIVAMSGESLGKLLINKFDIDLMVSKVIDKVTTFLSDVTGMKVIFKNLASTAIGIILMYAGIKMEFSDWIRVFLILLGLILLFSKDTLFIRLGNILDTALNYFGKKKDSE